MAVSLDKWKEAVLKRYPEARFMTQKMINGATIASDRSGQVGIYDPKNSYAKVGPETQQGVAEGSLNEFAPVGGDNREPDEEELISTCATICNEFGSLSVGRVFDTPCDEEIKDCGLDKFV